MNGVAQVAALFGAVAHIAVAQLEMLLLDRPRARRLLTEASADGLMTANDAHRVGLSWARTPPTAR
ncbi:hypothetical protein [Cellulomonas chengniuliangii]|uniref:hypothetical protein n=1 Tax=Cellulomonas chengniuliangii TaxID=2968084 RepID=UPI001D0E6B42|nr:hypothetical protein [Cellulomonas chengniuliangii]MCC2317079.1 hypothetical protein [Cellulomonas chengniuliangii]